MTIEQIIKQNCSDNEKLGMILSYHMNYMINGDGAITIKVWDKLVSDLISWKNTPENTSSNSDYAKCEHDFEPRKTWVHTCRKCGTVQIEKGHFAER